MKFVAKIASSVLLSCALAACASTSEPPRKMVDNYDFDYMVQSESIKIVQVFDDGKNTFFQLSANGSIPAVFAEIEGDFKFAQMEMFGPYIKIPFTAKRYMLKIGNSIARVAYVGERAKDSGPQVAESRSVNRPQAVDESVERQLPNEYLGGAWGRDRPQATTHNRYSYSDRMRGDRVEWTNIPTLMPEKPISFKFGTTTVADIAPKKFHAFAKEYADAIRIELIGYDDSSAKEGLAKERIEAVTSALVAAGIPRSVIRSKTARSVMQGSEKGKVLGVSIIGYKATLYAPETQPSISDATGPVASNSNSDSIGQVLKDLTLGRIKPAEAQAELARISKTNQTTRKPEIATWEIKKDDETLQVAIGRWAAQSGYEVVFESFPYVPLTGDLSFESKDFIGAIKYMMAQVKIAGYKIDEPTLYSDNVMVFGKKKDDENVK